MNLTTWHSPKQQPRESAARYNARRMAQGLMHEHPELTREQAIYLESARYQRALRKLLTGR